MPAPIPALPPQAIDPATATIEVVSFAVIERLAATITPSMTFAHVSVSIVLYATDPATPYPFAEAPIPAATAVVVHEASASTVTAPASMSDESAISACVALVTRFTVTAPANPTEVLPLSFSDRANAPDTAVFIVSFLARTSTPLLRVTIALLSDALDVSLTMLTETLPEIASPHLLPAGVSFALAESLGLEVFVPAAASVPVPIVPELVAVTFSNPTARTDPTPPRPVKECDVPVAKVPSRLLSRETLRLFASLESAIVKASIRLT